MEFFAKIAIMKEKFGVKSKANLGYIVVKNAAIVQETIILLRYQLFCTYLLLLIYYKHPIVILFRKLLRNTS
jgi:hypothetical protein